MDSFESVVAAILHREGYWTATSVKVQLTKEEKRRIGRSSSPRWEIDLVAYKPATNELLVVECKSFMDSPGVRVAVFEGEWPQDQKRYKLFFEATLRSVVLGRLTIQLEAAGLIRAKAAVVLCLAAGKIRGDPTRLESIFKTKGWRLFSPSYLRDALVALRDEGYENSIAAVVAKLLLRPHVTKKASLSLDADV